MNSMRTSGFFGPFSLSRETMTFPHEKKTDCRELPNIPNQIRQTKRCYWCIYITCMYISYTYVCVMYVCMYIYITNIYRVLYIYIYICERACVYIYAHTHMYV